MEETLLKLKDLMDNHKKLQETRVRLQIEKNSEFVAEPFDKAKIPSAELKKAKSGGKNVKVLIYTLIAFFVYATFFVCDYFFKWEFVFKIGEEVTAFKIFTSVVAVLCYTGITFLIIKIVMKNKKVKKTENDNKAIKELEAKHRTIYDQRVKESQVTFEKEKVETIAKLKEEIESLQKLIDDQDIVDKKCNTYGLVTHIYCLLQGKFETDLQKACDDALNRQDIDDSLKTKFCSALMSPETPEYKTKLVKDIMQYFKKNVDLFSDALVSDIENEDSKTMFYLYMMPYIGTLKSNILNITTEKGFSELFKEIQLVYQFYSQQESIMNSYKNLYGTHKK